MSWNNHGTYWHIDHIKPCASFDLTNNDALHMCYNWSNLRPLSALENLSKGDKVDNELLLEYQFERLDFVYEPGQFAIRGGIIDVFSYANDFPFRIEFFGDEVESIRTFDAANQLSLSSHKFLSILPNIQGQMSQNGVASIFSFIGENSTVWLSSFERI